MMIACPMNEPTKLVVTFLLVCSLAMGFQQPLKTPCAWGSRSTILSRQSESQATGPFTLSMSSSTKAETSRKLPGTAEMDVAWEDLGFEFRPTNSHVKMVWKDGEWQKPELISDGPYINLHIGATALHYGQSCFEGLKAFTHSDQSVWLFRPDENAKRMQNSCKRIVMPEIPTDLFVKCCQMAVADNIEYVPPYGSGGALYIRPLLFGSGPRIGLQPADEYTFIVLVIPVGDYYKGGLSKLDGLLITDYDRAAPRGVGNVKVAGNYAADILPNQQSKKSGYPIGLYCDAQTQKNIEEFSTSNFVGIQYGTDSNGGKTKFVTPSSPSVLPSITNKSLMQLARDAGMTVEERNIPVEELQGMDEVLAVGTAVVVTPIGSITQLKSKTNGEPVTYKFGDGQEVGQVTMDLYNKVRAIQNGEAEDVHGWNVKV